MGQNAEQQKASPVSHGADIQREKAFGAGSRLHKISSREIPMPEKQTWSVTVISVDNSIYTLVYSNCTWKQSMCKYSSGHTVLEVREHINPVDVTISSCLYGATTNSKLIITLREK